MNSYFFKMSKEERDNILDQHKEPYNGNIMQSQTSSNEQPLYVQDFANDKQGINIDIHGNVKPYTNFNINESHSGLDMIGDGDVDLKNGTVDYDSLKDTYDENNEIMHDVYPSPNENETDLTIISLGKQEDEPEFDLSAHEPFYDEEEFVPFYEYNIEELGDFESGPIDSLYHEVDSDILDDFAEKLNESLDMFRRFKKYN